MNNIEWIFFDMGSTLVNEFVPHQKRIDIIISELAKCGKIITSKELWERLYAYAKIGSKKPMYSVAESLGVDLVLQYERENEVAYPDAVECVKTLYKKYKLGIVANQPSNSEDRLRKYGFGDYFEFVVSSDDVKLYKPDIKIYEYALSKIDCEPHNVLMVGDRPDNDILPAAMAGMNTARIIRGFFSEMSNIIEPDITVKNLNELTKFLIK